MEKNSEVNRKGKVWWGEKGLTDERLKELLRGLTAGEKARVRALLLYRNDLTVVPDELMELRSLKHLNIRDNRISSLPSSVGQLTSMEFLYLDDNQLSMLPATMSNLQQLWRYVNPRFSCFLSPHSLSLQAEPQMERTAAAASSETLLPLRICSGSSPGHCGRR